MIALSNVAIRWRAEFVALTRVLLQAEELRAAFMLKKKDLSALLISIFHGIFPLRYIKFRICSTQEQLFSDYYHDSGNV